MLRLPFELSLALRYLRPKRTSVSVITLICILGVMIGVAVLIIVIAVMSGFDRELRGKLIGFNAHLKVGWQGRPVQDWESIQQQLEKVPGVRGVAPFILGQVLMQTQPDPGRSSPQSFAPYVRGIHPALEGRVTVLTNSVIEGEFDLRGNGLLVGSTLADILGIRVNDRVAVYSTHAIDRMLKSRSRTEMEAVPAENFVVRGIFSVGYDQIDATFVGMSLANAQDLYQLGDAVSGLTVMLHDSEPFNTRRAQAQIESLLGPDTKVMAWMDESRDLLEAIAVEKDAMLIILFFVMVVAAFCIVCSQIAFVIRKTREIGILKGLGATTGQVVSVFMLQSFAIGLFGVLAGLAAGCAGVAVRNDFLLFMRRVTGRELFPQSIYSFARIPAEVQSNDLILICGVSLGMCLLAGLVPAWIAASMKPVEALRND